jgi:hypothetical protein
MLLLDLAAAPARDGEPSVEQQPRGEAAGGGTGVTMGWEGQVMMV